MAGYPEGALMHSNKVAQGNMNTVDQLGLNTLTPAIRPRADVRRDPTSTSTLYCAGPNAVGHATDFGTTVFDRSTENSLSDPYS